jgi:hypothetical protein
VELLKVLKHTLISVLKRHPMVVADATEPVRVPGTGMN